MISTIFKCICPTWFCDVLWWYGKGTFVWKGSITSEQFICKFLRVRHKFSRLSTVHDEVQGSAIKIVYCVKNNNRKDKYVDVRLVSLLLTDSTYCSGTSNVDFEQVNSS